MATAPAPPPGALLDGMRLAAQRAADAVRELISSDRALDGAGTTLTALAWSGAELALVHVGDTRAYLLRGHDLLQLTHDDTLVQSLIDQGELTDQEARFDPRRATLIRALHGGDNTPPTVAPQYNPQPGDRYLLCSDGLHVAAPADAIARVLLTVPDPDQAAADLITLAMDAGAPDNITCIVADLTAQPAHPRGQPRQ